MAVEPLVLYSTREDLREVLHKLRVWGLEVELTGPEDDWKKARVILEFDGQPGPLGLTFHRDPMGFSEPTWSERRLGMIRYVRTNFPESPRKDAVVEFLAHIRSGLGTTWDPDPIMTGDRDERNSLLSAVARAFDCVVFSPSTLRDWSGKVL